MSHITPVCVLEASLGSEGCRLHHIGVGRTRIIMLVDDLHVRVINAATGELLRHLTIDTTKDYQPLHRPPGPPPQKPQQPDPK